MFKRRRCVIAALLSFVLVHPSLTVVGQSTSQPSTPRLSAPRDEASLSIVNRAIALMGGVSVIGGIHDAGASGNCVVVDSDANDGSPTTGPYSWKTSGREFRYEAGTGQNYSISASGHGKPARFSNGTVTPESYTFAHATMPYQLPALVLYNDLQDTQFGLRAMGQQSLQGTPVQVIRIALYGPDRISKSSVQMWYFSSSSGLPVQVDYLAPGETTPELLVPVSYGYSNFQAQSGVMVPMSIQTLIGSQVFSNCTNTQVEVNQGYPSTTFDLANGGGL